MSKGEDLKNKLASTLENRREKPVPKPVQEKGQTTDAADAKETSATKKGVIKLSVSLYDFDIECLDRIKDAMKSFGVRNLSDSEALRLACRIVHQTKMEADFKVVYDKMLGEDRRRKKH